MNKIPGGLLIVIEGIDGAGKTTQAALLAQYFGQMGYPVLMSKEPTCRKWGAMLRESAATGRFSPREEHALFIADRKDHVEQVIQPALREGLVVILDRYFYSMAAYQSKTDEDVAAILAENEAFAPIPDCLFLLDVNPRQGIGRIRARGDAPNSFESETQLTHAAKVFRSIQQSGAVHLDGTAPVAKVHQEIRDHSMQVAQRKID